MNICFLTSAHDAFDDRIYYHMASSLSEAGHSVLIISSTSGQNEIRENIKLKCFNGNHLSGKKKAEEFKKRLQAETPEVIICSEPLPVYAANLYRKSCIKHVRIIYDITEWYPSKKNLCRYNAAVKWFHAIKLVLFNIWMSRLSDSFIFGEYYKSKPYRILFPAKTFIFIPYFPDLRYIEYANPQPIKNRLRLQYSGKLNKDKGYDNFIKVVERLSDLNRNLNIEIKIIGRHDSCENINNRLQLTIKENITVTYYDRLPFLEYIDLIKETDIFLDLRTTDIENNHCLPIKLFYYASLSRPVIYSDLKAIRKEIDINSLGFLVQPSDIETIINLINDYINNPVLYLQHCKAARKIIEDRYNWKVVESGFINFVTTKTRST